MRDQLEQLRAECFRMLHNINSNIGQIVTYPTRHVNPEGNLIQENVDNTVAPTAILKNHPQDLYELWIEYTTGLEGNKPARLFNASERGCVKDQYTQRKVFWDLVTRLIHKLVCHAML